MSSARKEETLAKLQAGVEAVFDSDKWREYLKFAARFHSYSFCNSLLIWMQVPHASRVAGYRAWQELGRQVRKGETAIYIFAPSFRKRRKQARPEDEAGEVDGEDEAARVLAYFVPVPVFDVSQTEGADLPSLVSTLAGDDAGLVDALTDFARAQGFEVKFESIPGEARGWCNLLAEPRVICIDPGQEPLGIARTLTHEIAHVLLHGRGRQDAAPPSARTMEVEAESIAYMVLAHFDLDASAASFGYLAGWAGAADNAAAELKAAGGRIVQTAGRIIDGLAVNRQAAVGVAA